MDITSNETAWAIMIIMLIHSSFMTWLAITIRTETDKDAFIAKSKRFLFKAVIFSGNTISAIILIMQLMATTPISRLDVFTIVLAITFILMSINLTTFNTILKLASAQSDHLTKTGVLIDLIKKQKENKP